MAAPKFKVGDRVVLQLPSAGIYYIGTVAIVDAYGTFECPGEPSYDVDVASPYSEEHILFKHIAEDFLTLDEWD